VKTGRFGGVLLATGAAVGAAAVVGLVLGFEPSKLPAALIDIAVYKLTFVAAAGLLAAGAIVRRYARRDATVQDARVPAGLPLEHDVPRLPDASVDEVMRNRDQRTDVRVPRQD